MIKKILLVLWVLFFTVILSLIIIAEVMFEKSHYKTINNTIDYKIEGQINYASDLHYGDTFGYYITISSDTVHRFQIFTYSNGTNFKQHDIKVRDSIFKEKDSNLLYVYKKDTLFNVFILEE